MFIRYCTIDYSGVQISLKPIYERFRRMVFERKNTARDEHLTSGNVEDLARIDVYLDVMILDIAKLEDENEKINEA